MVGKNNYSVFIFIFFCRMKTKTEMTETNRHIRLVRNELNRSGLYRKQSVTGNQVGNIDQHNSI
jgi:hypothetical protein